MFYSSLVSAVFILPIALIGESTFTPSTFEGWIPLMLLGLVAHVFAQGLIANGLNKLSTHVAALVIMLEGASAMIVGALFYQESRNWLDLVAVIVVTLGIYSAQAWPSRDR
jgi:drug/metabolite transporter (DMT)-like permease